MTEDLGEMNWDDAMKACADLGDGWRLPTKDELNLLYENRIKLAVLLDPAIGVLRRTIQLMRGYRFHLWLPDTATLRTTTSYVRAVRAF